jgi:hypothetical protein
MNGHECMGGCGRRMAYPGDRCPQCRQWLTDQRQVWDDAAENVRGLGITIAREMRRDF